MHAHASNVFRVGSIGQPDRNVGWVGIRGVRLRRLSSGRLGRLGKRRTIGGAAKG